MFPQGPAWGGVHPALEPQILVLALHPFCVNLDESLFLSGPHFPIRNIRSMARWSVSHLPGEEALLLLPMIIPGLS